MAVHRLLLHLTRTRAAAGTALVLGLVALPTLPRTRQPAARTPASTAVRTAERDTQLARIARWREIRREARAHGHTVPDANPAPTADSVRPGDVAPAAPASHPPGG